MAESLELGGTDLVGLHEYTVGDDLRRLHWATSARTGTLMVREDADPAQPHVCVLLDDRQQSYAHPDDFEEAVELAAALCRVAVEAGDPLRLRTSSGRHDLTVPGSTTRHLPREGLELEWLLAEIDSGRGPHAPPVPPPGPRHRGERDRGPGRPARPGPRAGRCPRHDTVRRGPGPVLAPRACSESPRSCAPTGHRRSPGCGTDGSRERRLGIPAAGPGEPVARHRVGGPDTRAVPRGRRGAAARGVPRRPPPGGLAPGQPLE